MAGEWSKVPVVSVAEVVIGGTPSRNIPEYWNGSIPWATARDVATVTGRYLDRTKEFITEDGLRNSATKLFPKGAVVITARGTVGALAQLGREMALNQTCYAITPKKGAVDGDFLFYALKATIDEMRSLAYGTVFDTITKQTFDHWLIPLPPLPEQRAIAQILGTLDDKIELNRRMSETLEGMARAIFKAWFVDFEPVRAKMEGRWRRGESLPGLPAHLYDLFPARLVDSELGEIPEGWGVDKIGNQFRITMGQSPPGSTYNENGEGLPFYQGRMDFGFRFPARRVFCTAHTRFAEAGDTLLTVRAPVSDVNMALERCAIGRGVAAVRHATGSRSCTYYLARSLKPIFENFEAEGTVFGAINKEALASIKCAVPPTRLVEQFEALCKPLGDQIENNEFESRTLAALRDALLPKLIRREIRVKDAERFLKERGL